MYDLSHLQYGKPGKKQRDKWKGEKAEINDIPFYGISQIPKGQRRDPPKSACSTHSL